LMTPTSSTEHVWYERGTYEHFHFLHHYCSQSVDLLWFCLCHTVVVVDFANEKSGQLNRNLHKEKYKIRICPSLAIRQNKKPFPTLLGYGPRSQVLADYATDSASVSAVPLVKFIVAASYHLPPKVIAPRFSRNPIMSDSEAHTRHSSSSHRIPRFHGTRSDD
jgi:hypothetical protein